MKDLTQCRAEIDAIDRQLAALFEMRMQVSRDVAAYKHAHHIDILDISREQAVLKSRAEMIGEDSLRQPAAEFFSTIMRLSRNEQARCIAQMNNTDSAVSAGRKE